jgi:lysophospholipase L1-like esterase
VKPQVDSRRERKTLKARLISAPQATFVPWCAILLLLFCTLAAAATTHKRLISTKTRHQAEASKHARTGKKPAAQRTFPRRQSALVKQTTLIHGRRVTRYVPAKPAPSPRRYAAAPQQTAPIPAPAPESFEASPAPTATLTEPQAFLYPTQLTPFFESLDALKSDPAATVRVLQFGDSHTAADMFTGAVRSQLQARFGNGGLGFQYPGHPFAGYHLAGSTRTQSEGWSTDGNRFTQIASTDLGLGGVSLSTHRAGEYITLSTTCTSFEVEYLRQPAGGRLRFVDNGTTVADIDTGTETNDDPAGTYTYACTPGLHDFHVSTLDPAPVKLLGLVSDQPGITYEELGLNGAVATLMLRWNQALFAAYLRDRAPNLIVLAYGTNEAVYIASHSEEYLEQFERLVGNLHRYAPQAAILVLGPYDRATRIGRGRHTSWATFYGTERVIADQKLACRALGCAFYDQQQRMGGPGAMIRWAAEGLAQPDRTHLTGAGYRTIANAFTNDLLQAYKLYQQPAVSSKLTTRNSRFEEQAEPISIHPGARK